MLKEPVKSQQRVVEGTLGVLVIKFSLFHFFIVHSPTDLGSPLLALIHAMLPGWKKKRKNCVKFEAHALASPK